MAQKSRNQHKCPYLREHSAVRLQFEMSDGVPDFWMGRGHVLPYIGHGLAIQQTALMSLHLQSFIIQVGGL